MIDPNISQTNLGRVARIISNPHMNLDYKVADSVSQLFKNQISSPAIQETKAIKWAAYNALLTHVSWSDFHRFVSALYNWCFQDGKFESSDWRILHTIASNYSHDEGFKTYVQHEILKHCGCILQAIQQSPGCTAKTTATVFSSDNADAINIDSLRALTKSTRKELRQLRSILQELQRTGLSTEIIQEDINHLTTLLQLSENSLPSIAYARQKISNICGLALNQSSQTIEQDIDIIKTKFNDQQEVLTDQTMQILEAYGELEGVLCGDLSITRDTLCAADAL